MLNIFRIHTLNFSHIPTLSFSHILTLSFFLVLSSSLSISIVYAQTDSESGIVGSVEGELLTNGVWLRNSGDHPRRTQALSPMWGTRLALDIPMNHYLWLGGEMTVLWLSEPALVTWLNDQPQAELRGGERVTFSPSLRGRIDFPLDCRWYLEGLIAGGVSRWGENRGGDSGVEDDVRWGITWRMSLGLRYAINTEVQAVMAVGYTEQSGYGDDDINFSAYPVSIGLRGGF